MCDFIEETAAKLWRYEDRVVGRKRNEERL